MQEHRPEISIVIATYNRREVVANTLARLCHCGFARGGYEVIVVDNASTDGTPETIAGDVDLLIELPRNAGSCAKAYGARRARGRYIVFLDDDSYPRPGSLSRMIEHFGDDAKLASAGFTVHLPGGASEGGALPGVFVGCGVGLRAEALREVGGLDPTFFMQAEEYDLCFRLYDGGWKVAVFDDLHVDHLKSQTARRPARATFLDVRNNLRVIARYLPTFPYRVYREDYLRRYRWLAERDGHRREFARGVRAGAWRSWRERWRHRDRRLRPEAFERFFCWGEILARTQQLITRGWSKVLLADLGKNLYPFYRAANVVGLDIVAIADDRLAASGRSYRGVAVLQVEDALQRDFDAVVVSNTSRVHAAVTAEALASRTDRPVLNWFVGRTAEDRSGFCFGDPRKATDNTREQGVSTGGM